MIMFGHCTEWFAKELSQHNSQLSALKPHLNSPDAVERVLRECDHYDVKEVSSYEPQTISQ
jgi:hypothetical protein